MELPKEKALRVFGNKVALALPPSNEAMEAIRELRKQLPAFLDEQIRAERERIKSYLRGKEIVVTDGDGNKETVIRVGNFLAALEDWPDLPETSY